jgi:hypothetical protein
MPTQHGNSGRGTDLPAPRMRGEDARKSAVSRGESSRGKQPPQKGRRPREAGAKSARQAGGGKHSESEKPSSPRSRWGGGRGPT